MALPINIHELIHGSTVEWECIEFKEGTKSGLGWDQVALIQNNNQYLSDIDVGDISIVRQNSQYYMFPRRYIVV
jgi:hypothetical protein